jgi:hypothetical protein
MTIKMGGKAFELDHYRKLPDYISPDGMSSEACTAVQDRGLRLAREPLQVYTFRRMVEEMVPSKSPWGGYDKVMVGRDFRAYRCQYPKRDTQAL